MNKPGDIELRAKPLTDDKVMTLLDIDIPDSELAGRSEGLRSSISRSLGRDVYSHLIILTYHTTLLTILVVLRWIILVLLTYGHSNLAIHFFNAITAIPSE
jgi:hypothetical protein